MILFTQILFSSLLGIVVVANVQRKYGYLLEQRAYDVMLSDFIDVHDMDMDEEVELFLQGDVEYAWSSKYGPKEFSALTMQLQNYQQDLHKLRHELQIVTQERNQFRRVADEHALNDYPARIRFLGQTNKAYNKALFTAGDIMTAEQREKYRICMEQNGYADALPEVNRKRILEMD